MGASLESIGFNPVVSDWFAARFGEPTDAQRAAWPPIAAGEHVLVSAPTGSGKTLTAFLWALDRLLTGAWPAAAEDGHVRVLYLSPLKALNNDIQRNLRQPLAELEASFAEAGLEPRPVGIGVRSGDTPQSERRKMLRRPPEILITTPESLNILLTSPRGRLLFGGLETVILDEIHAIAGGKRGTHLITAVDRLVELSGEFQRLALSATARPLAELARFVGGWRLERTAGHAVYARRDVRLVRSEARKVYDLEVSRPAGLVDVVPGRDEGSGATPPENLWESLTEAFKHRIRSNRSTLLFANSRRATEKITRFLNEGGSAELAYSHHGSLSRELRAVVEERLKQGRLKAIVATNSLELGIDIGALDEVLLVATPPSVAAAIQRVGRAGHRVGEVSRARLYPLFGRDLIHAAVVARAVLDHDIEEVEPVRGALDVLAQVILSMTAGTSRNVDELYDRIRTSYPYRDLPRKQFDLVLEMLAGRYSESRIRELEPRLAFDRLEGTVLARRGSERLLYVAGGTIPDRGYFRLRHHESMARLGELDEEFVWERSLGDTFTLGAQAWRIRKITHSDVLVSPVAKGAAFAPFWRAEERNRSVHLSERIGRFLERADTELRGRDGRRNLAQRLVGEHAFEAAAAEALVGFLEEQRLATDGLPHRHRLVAEKLAERETDEGRRAWVLHTGWGGRVNRPLALVLPPAYRALSGQSLEADANNDSLLVLAPDGFEPAAVFEYLATQPLEMMLRTTLEPTGFFGARFRENAGRALLLPRSDLKRRVPLWLQRERGKQLLGTVAKFGDFPIVVETWRTCLEEEFELEALKRFLAEIEQGTLDVVEVATEAPSPFAGDLLWKRTNRLMYLDDSAERDRGTALDKGWLRELVLSAELRPKFPEALLVEFESKLQRTQPGYAPRDDVELVEWVKERWVLPESEWLALTAAVERDRNLDAPGSEADEEEGDDRVGPAATRLVRARWSEPVVCARERLPALVAAFGPPEALESLAGDEAARVEAARVEAARVAAAPADGGLGAGEIVAEWLRFYGPVPAERLRASFGLETERLDALLETLVEDGHVVIDRFRRETDTLEIADAENLERLLRIDRARRRPSLEARPLVDLPLFLATRQGLTARGASSRELQTALGRLLGYPAAARLWETEILPARLDTFYPSWLDSLFQDSDLVWLGCGAETVTFAFPEEVGLLVEPAEPAEVDEVGAAAAVDAADAADAAAAAGSAAGSETDVRPASEATVLPSAAGRFRFEEIVARRDEPSSEVAAALWREAWSGRVSNTTFAALRQGIAQRFRLPGDSASGSRQATRAGAGRRPQTLQGQQSQQSQRNQKSRRRRPTLRQRPDRWRSQAIYAGEWYALDPPTGVEGDALDREEANKDRVRLLLDRYGVLFRELLARELVPLRWGRLFRTLRLMELSGEIVAGQFFEGIAGLQFASHEAVRTLRAGLRRDAIYWLSAADPAAATGLGLEGLRHLAPKRLASTHLVFHGAERVLLSERNGRRLSIEPEADHPRLRDYLGVLGHLLTRPVAPEPRLEVETVNGEPAATSPYAEPFLEVFDGTREGGVLRLRRRYVPTVSSTPTPTAAS